MPPIVAAAAIGGGSTIIGGLLGRSGNNIQQQQLQLAQRQQAMAEPAYHQAYDYYSKLLSGDGQTTLQAVSPQLQQLNTGFDTAKKNLLGSSMARGGGLTSGLAGLEGQRALGMGQLVGNAQQGAAAALGGLASGNMQQALAALGGAQQGQFQNAYLQQQSSAGIGSFLTRLLSGLSTNNDAGGNNSFNPGSPVIPWFQGPSSAGAGPYGSPYAFTP